VGFQNGGRLLVPWAGLNTTNDAHTTDEIGKARIRAKRIEPRSPRKPEQVTIPEPVGGFEPIERRVNIAESSVDCREGDRRGLTSGAELLEFLEKAPGFVCPAQPAINMSQVGE